MCTVNADIWSGSYIQIQAQYLKQLGEIWVKISGGIYKNVELDTNVHTVSHKFKQDGEAMVLDVRGLIYHGDLNFRYCIIESDRSVWYHNGIITGSTF